MASGRDRSKAQERRLAKATDGRRIPYSGAGAEKGDVHSTRVFYECKSSARRGADGAKSIGVKKADLTKMLDQQAKEAKTLHAMTLHFVGDRNDWVVMSWAQWVALTGEGKADAD